MASSYSVEDLKLMRRAMEDARSDAAKYRQWARICDLDAERYQGMLDRALLRNMRMATPPGRAHQALADADKTPEGRKWAHRVAEDGRVQRVVLPVPCPGCAERCGQCAEDALD